MISAATRRLVRRRAESRCEYCRLPESAVPFLTFHVEHIRAKPHRGNDQATNLALACPDCNRHKGPNLAAIDSVSEESVPLFNPRKDAWYEHFELQGAMIVGTSSIGRATAELLRFNDAERIEIREQIIDLDEW